MTNRVLFLDDSGNPDARHASGAVVIAGLAVPSESVPALSRRIPGAKNRYFPDRGHPASWEVKSESGYYASSHTTQPIQVADLVAGIRRRVIEGDANLAEIDRAVAATRTIPRCTKQQAHAKRTCRSQIDLFQKAPSV